MVQGMNPFDPLASHMRIYLCRGNIRMPEQHLYHPQICAVVEQMGSEGMTKRMGGHGSADACRGGVPLDQMPEGLARHG
jgi:hypothetical protein